LRSPPINPGDRPFTDPLDRAEMRHEILEELFAVMDFVSPAGGVA